MFLYLVVFSKKLNNPTLLKKRYFKLNRYPNLYFGDAAVIVNTHVRFEFCYYFFLRKFLKKMVRKKKKFYTKKYKIWFSLRPNHILTKKAKNARMGKGKGAHIRWCSIIPKGCILLEFKGLSIIRLRKYTNKLEKKLKIPLTLYCFSTNFNKIYSQQFYKNCITTSVTPHNYYIEYVH